MRLDQISLRVMLFSLGATALAGVATIFTQGNDVLWRLLGTATATSVAAGVMWPLTLKAEKPETRLAGLVGMGAVLVDFFLVLILIWERLFLPQGMQQFEEGVIFQASYLLPLTAAPAVMCLLFLHRPGGRLAAIAGALASAVTFAELMIGAWQSHSRFFPSPTRDWADAAWATALFGALGTACLAGTVAERPWRWGGVGVSLLGWLMMSDHALRGTHSEIGQSVFTVIATVAVVIAYMNLFSIPELAPSHQYVRVLTMLVAVLTAVLIDVLTLNRINNSSYFGTFDDLLGRLAAASGIVTACGTVAILILALINRKQMKGETYVAMSWVEMAITCPACQRQQTVSLGESTCSGCGLEFSIRIGERRNRD